MTGYSLACKRVSRPLDRSSVAALRWGVLGERTSLELGNLTPET